MGRLVKAAALAVGNAVAATVVVAACGGTALVLGFIVYTVAGWR